MRNLTVSVKEEVARWARIWAARHDTSVSRLVGQLLEERMLREQGYKRAMRDYLSASPAPLKKETGYPAREQLHDRQSLR
ncbi:MAG: DUF6364 family protein [Acidobacteriota bacterium]